MSTAEASGRPLTSPARLVRLNVGGQLFCTTEHTLLWAGGQTFFHGLLSGRFVQPVDEQGAIFIDRDPLLFAAVLNYLRNKDVRPGPEVGALRLTNGIVAWALGPVPLLRARCCLVF